MHEAALPITMIFISGLRIPSGSRGMRYRRMSSACGTPKVDYLD